MAKANPKHTPYKIASLSPVRSLGILLLKTDIHTSPKRNIIVQSRFEIALHVRCNADPSVLDGVNRLIFMKFNNL